MIERAIWLVPLAVTACGIWRPRAGLLVFVAALPFFGSPPGGPYLAALDAACLAAILTGWRGGRMATSPLTWPAAAFVLVGLLSLVPLPYLPPSWRPAALLQLVRALPGAESWSAFYTWRSAADLALGFGLFLTVRRAFAGRSPRPLFRAILVGFTAVVVLGLAAVFNLVDLTAYRPKVPLEAWSQRLQSVFFLSGWLSKYLIVAAPAALVVVATARRWSRTLLALGVAFTLVCLALAQSRGAWPAAAAQILAAAVLAARLRLQMPGTWRTLAAIAALTAVVAGLAVVASGSRLTIDRPEPLASSLTSRASLWTSAVDMVRDRPLLGSGLGGFAPAYDRLNPEGSPRARRHHSTAHNLYLHVAAETGLLGLSALGLLGATAALGLRRAGAGRRRWAAATALCLVGAAVYGLTQNMMYLRSIHWLLWILLAAAALCAGGEDIRHTKRAAQLAVLAALAALPFRFSDLAAAPRWPGDRELGFHETERNDGGAFRWTAGEAARRVVRGDGDLVLTLANGHPAAADRPVTVAIGIDGRETATVDVAGGWQEHRIALDPRTPASFLLSLRVEPSFRPFSEFRRLEPPVASLDVRLLGVAVRDIGWRRVADAPDGSAP